jgi:toxin ParE1/3/4
MADIVWSPQSRSDWADILLYIRANNRAAARRLHDQFIETLQLLSQFPEMGRARPELGRLLRSFPVGNYIVIYRPRKGGIELVRVLHGARDIRRIFKRK